MTVIFIVYGITLILALILPFIVPWVIKSYKQKYPAGYGQTGYNKTGPEQVYQQQPGVTYPGIAYQQQPDIAYQSSTNQPAVVAVSPQPATVVVAGPSSAGGSSSGAAVVEISSQLEPEIEKAPVIAATTQVLPDEDIIVKENVAPEPSKPETIVARTEPARVYANMNQECMASQFKALASFNKKFKTDPTFMDDLHNYSSENRNLTLLRKDISYDPVTESCVYLVEPVVYERLEGQRPKSVTKSKRRLTIPISQLSSL